MKHLKRLIIGFVLLALVAGFFLALKYIITAIPYGLVALGVILVFMAAYVLGFFINWVFDNLDD